MQTKGTALMKVLTYNRYLNIYINFKLKTEVTITAQEQKVNEKQEYGKPTVAGITLTINTLLFLQHSEKHTPSQANF